MSNKIDRERIQYVSHQMAELNEQGFKDELMKLFKKQEALAVYLNEQLKELKSENAKFLLYYLAMLTWRCYNTGSEISISEDELRAADAELLDKAVLGDDGGGYRLDDLPESDLNAYLYTVINHSADEDEDKGPIFHATATLNLALHSSV